MGTHDVSCSTFFILLALQIHSHARVEWIFDYLRATESWCSVLRGVAELTFIFIVFSFVALADGLVVWERKGTKLAKSYNNNKKWN